MSREVVTQTPEEHAVQIRTFGRLIDDLYMLGAIEIGDVRREYARATQDDEIILLNEFGPVLRAVLQAGVGLHGAFEGVKR